MSLPTLNENLNIHQSLPDKPALNAEELKQEFDKAPNLIKEYLNGTLLSQIDTLMVNLQNKDITLETALNTLNGIVSEAVSNINNLTSNVNTNTSNIKDVTNKVNINTNDISNIKNILGATTKISSGTGVPSSLANGEIYLQYF